MVSERAARGRSGAAVPPHELGTRNGGNNVGSSAIRHHGNDSRLIDCRDGGGGLDQGYAALAAAFKNVKGTLEGGLNTGERVGRPISAKFVLEDGMLRLSLWIEKRDGVSEFNLYPAIGMINEVVGIERDKIEAAIAQKLAIDSATISLFSATENAVKASKGFRAISVLPMLSEGRPVAVATLRGPYRIRVVDREALSFRVLSEDPTSRLLG
jgi:hypothetical protein